MSEVESSQDEKRAKPPKKKERKGSKKVRFKIIKRAIRPDQRRETVNRVHEFQRTIALIVTAAVVLLFVVAITYITPIKGKLDLEQGSANLVLHDELLFIPSYANGTRVVDVSDPADPRAVARFGPDLTKEDMAVAIGEYEASPENQTVAFIGHWSGGFRALDITDAKDPQTLAEITEPGTAFVENMELANGYLYVQSCEVTIFDVRDPTQPVNVSTIKPSGKCAGALFIEGDLLYLGHQGLKIYDISDPANASLIGEISLTGPMWTVKVEGDTAFVAAGVEGFHIVDVSEPTAPQQLASQSNLRPVNDLQPYEKYLYVSVGHKGMQIFDVSDPTDPELVNDRFFTDYTFKILADDEYLYVLDRDSNLRVLTIDSDGDGKPIGKDAYPPFSFLYSRWQGLVISLIIIGILSLVIMRHFQPQEMYRPKDDKKEMK